MQSSNWLAFCSVSLLAGVTPGPAVVLAISNSVEHGPRRALISSLGNVLGLFIMSAFVMLGLGVLLAASAIGFTTLKILGAGYLVYLGVRQWRSRGLSRSTVGVGSASVTGGRLFRQGLYVALTNPKALLFYAALFPQFLTRHRPLPEQFFILTTTFALCIFLVHVVYVLLAHSVKSYLANPRLLHFFNRVVGAVYIGLGLGMLRLSNESA